MLKDKHNLYGTILLGTNLREQSSGRKSRTVAEWRNLDIFVELFDFINFFRAHLLMIITENFHSLFLTMQDTTFSKIKS